LFLQNVEIFKNIPSEIVDLILDKLTTRYYKAGEIVHEECQAPLFKGVVYIGSLEAITGKKVISFDKNDIVMKDAFVGGEHPTIRCKE